MWTHIGFRNDLSLKILSQGNLVNCLIIKLLNLDLNIPKLKETLLMHLMSNVHLRHFLKIQVGQYLLLQGH